MENMLISIYQLGTKFRKVKLQKVYNFKIYFYDKIKTPNNGRKSTIK
jgi:hypothetical protein